MPKFLKKNASYNGASINVSADDMTRGEATDVLPVGLTREPAVNYSGTLHSTAKELYKWENSARKSYFYLPS